MNVTPDRTIFDENLRAIDNVLTKKHGFALSSDDLGGIASVYGAFFLYGPMIRYSSNSGFAGSGQPTNADLTSDPLDPWVKGAAILYTREFFEDVKAHLNPGGAVTLFVQLYESNTEAVKSEIGTFFKAFPNGMLFGNTNNGVGYDLVLFGQVEPTTINLDAIDARLKQPGYAKVAQSVREIGFNSAVDLFSTYAGSASDLRPWLQDAPINRDRNLRLQYLAGLGANVYQSGPIYADMLSYRKLPQDLFVGPDALKNAVMARIQDVGHY